MLTGKRTPKLIVMRPASPAQNPLLRKFEKTMTGWEYHEMAAGDIAYEKRHSKSAKESPTRCSSSGCSSEKVSSGIERQRRVETPIGMFPTVRRATERRRMSAGQGLVHKVVILTSASSPGSRCPHSFKWWSLGEGGSNGW